VGQQFEVVHEQQKQQLINEALLAAAKAATSPDTFKDGDLLAGGRCVSWCAMLLLCTFVRTAVDDMQCLSCPLLLLLLLLSLQLHHCDALPSVSLLCCRYLLQYTVLLLLLLQPQCVTHCLLCCIFPAGTCCSTSWAAVPMA
jgi:hypothetical protein